MFDFSNLFCCNPQCNQRNTYQNQGNTDINQRNSSLNEQNFRQLNQINNCPCQRFPQNGNRQNVIMGPRGPRGFTGPRGAAGTFDTVSSLLVSDSDTQVGTITQIAQDQALPLSLKISDKSDIATLSGENQFTLNKVGNYLAIFTVQLDTVSTAAAATVSISLSDENGNVYGYATMVDNNRKIPYTGFAQINVTDVTQKYQLTNTSGAQISVAPLTGTGDQFIRPAVQITIIQLV